MPDSPFITTHEAADYLRLSPKTLEKHRVTGEGPVYHRLGRRVFYRVEDLNAWAATKRRSSTSDPGLLLR